MRLSSALALASLAACAWPCSGQRVGAPAAAAAPPSAAAKKTPPNFVWLHVESTDGRTYEDDMADLVPIPRIRGLMRTGANFVNAYANVPICCPSRASVWAGREGHNMPHTTNGIRVQGAWNNYEGFQQGPDGDGFDSKKISDRLRDQGNYTINILGKEDWMTGNHSMNTMIDSFSIYSRWPYNIPDEGPSQGGFHIWGDCGGNVTVNPGNVSGHRNDWRLVREGTAWLHQPGPDGAAANQPFFLYDGATIVHPPYHTDQEHWNRIPAHKIKAPAWPALDDEGKVHPCDLQMSMKKGCAFAQPHADDTGNGDDEPSALHPLDSDAHKIGIRRAYYAMISEWDDMVGAYIDAVEQNADPAVAANTVFVVSSDHGDMQMEHQQFYKMSAFEGSTRVPIVISGPGVNAVGNVKQLVTLVDLMPTFLDLAGLPLPPKYDPALNAHGRWPAEQYGQDQNDPMAIDGTSLVPLLQKGDAAADSHPDHIISQFHGENAGMSWFMLRKGDMKLVQWGTGEQNPPQLFNLTADPDEWHNLALDTPGNAQYKPLLAELDKVLRAKIDYPEVAKDVARYNIQMARWWTRTEPNWRAVLAGKGLAEHSQPPGHNCSDPKAAERCEIFADEAWWGELWQTYPDGYWSAWNHWIEGSIGDDVSMPACPSGLVHDWKKQTNAEEQ